MNEPDYVRPSDLRAAIAEAKLSLREWVEDHVQKLRVEKANVDDVKRLRDQVERDVSKIEEKCLDRRAVREIAIAAIKEDEQETWSGWTRVSSVGLFLLAFLGPTISIITLVMTR